MEKKFHDDQVRHDALSALWKEYKTWGIKDRKFDKDFTDGRNDHFHPYVFEMWLARHLKNLGYDLRSDDAGPDFQLCHAGQVIWIEATCPVPKLRSPSIEHGREDIRHRLIAALREKTEKRSGRLLKNGSRKSGYLGKSIVGAQDPYVVAISTSRLTMGREEEDWYQGVFEDEFRHPNLAGVSAVLITDAGLEAVCGAGAVITVFHNPVATNVLPHGVLGADVEYLIRV